jgi:hypothetical protein
MHPNPQRASQIRRYRHEYFLKIPELFPWHDPFLTPEASKMRLRVCRERQSELAGKGQSRMVDLPNWLARYGFPRERATKARDSCTVTLTRAALR